MKSAFSHYAAMACCAAALLAGCSQQSGAPAPDASQQQAQQTQAGDAARNLDTYRQLLRIQNDEMAVTMGQDIVKRFPNSDAAKEVQQTLPEIEKRYSEASEKNRLASLWLYQVSPMAGGTQSTATIANNRVQLVLRRHTSWGQSVFLYGSKPGFVCHGNCAIASTVDGKPMRIMAFAPPTGEPALMIRDDKAFIAMLQKAKKITLDVTLADGEKKQTLVYEVGGFDPAKWVGVGKQGKK
ncbi:hypothetical protein GCM10008098_22190 [Rhodanobacter panaciterrae]|uniref:Lipoprotein n=1 Tax=Rhodanobacter panaciterrae TaxID=490572 RepID=A0ABQ3A038_9GAMM|nr:hypothetical protein [Rhodanobacter panaciterrae]GGY28580.1 hypothetical protein GCM10008098_22190 [Rhodanobacter panaciterrae]